MKASWDFLLEVKPSITVFKSPCCGSVFTDDEIQRCCRCNHSVASFSGTFYENLPRRAIPTYIDAGDEAGVLGHLLAQAGIIEPLEAVVVGCELGEEMEELREVLKDHDWSTL